MGAEVLNGTVEVGDRVAYGALGGIRLGVVLDIREHRKLPRLKIEVTHGDSKGAIVYYPYLRKVAKLS